MKTFRHNEMVTVKQNCEKSEKKTVFIFQSTTAPISLQLWEEISTHGADLAAVRVGHPHAKRKQNLLFQSSTTLQQ